jgi:sulfide:quinone oxidoreductase
MNINKFTDSVSITSQITLQDLPLLKVWGYEVVVCNRPDNESADQPLFNNIQVAAGEAGLDTYYLPFTGTQIPEEYIDQFNELIVSGKRILAYCRTGNRSCNLLAESLLKSGGDLSSIIPVAKSCGYNINNFLNTADMSVQDIKSTKADSDYDVVIVGGGSGGISVAASLLKRRATLRIAIIDPSGDHYYQPGWTLVGGGAFNIESTRQDMCDLIPKGVNWIKQSVVEFSPAKDSVILNDGRIIHYKQLVVCPGLSLDWQAIEGLEETLGKNGVTSNYRYDLAPYTWKLIREFHHGEAVFTQPPMPIKCAGAPQKAMYLAADHWLKQNCLQYVRISFFSAGNALFGVGDYIPALQKYIDKYRVGTQFGYQLYKIDGESKKAFFRKVEGETETLVEKSFDMIHVCPPQKAPEFIRTSPLSDAGGWLDVDPHTLRHKNHENIWGLGDVINTANAKTMAAVRKQAPIVAQNIIDTLHGYELKVGYDGYGSCPLTVENGKVVLAEFGYGGKIMPTFPCWVFGNKQPSATAWLLKKYLLPGIYWRLMLKGHEILAAPRSLNSVKSS